MDKNGILKKFRKWKQRYLFRGDVPDAARVRRAVDKIIERAKRGKDAGMSTDRWLFAFESDFEEISDEIARLKDDGQTDAYRDIYAQLYLFAKDVMEDSYMPMYLNIIYRYACSLLETGKEQTDQMQAEQDGAARSAQANEAHPERTKAMQSPQAEAAQKALRLFEKLYERTDRLIGIGNPYGIHCLEKIAQAALRCGQSEKASRALREMASIAEEEFGPHSAMMQAVQRCEARLAQQ